jgi:hypothetical protein
LSSQGLSVTLPKGMRSILIRLHFHSRCPFGFGIEVGSGCIVTD